MKVFYNPKCSAATDSFSPSSKKPALVAADWEDQFPDLTFVRSRIAALRELELGHDSIYVKGVLDGLVPNGFDNYDREVARSLPYTVGAMVDAAIYAYQNKTCAAAPVSGFHHAHYNRAEGFCTFNGLVVAARLALLAGAKSVAIIDLDQHYGNGTQDIIDHLQLQDYIGQYSEHVRELEAEHWLSALPGIVKACCESADLILYQAGADSHVDDPLGGYLTTEQIRKRDKIVFETCHAEGVPVAWNLAGGYQKDGTGGIEPVLALHRATMEECLKVYGNFK